MLYWDCVSSSIFLDSFEFLLFLKSCANIDFKDNRKGERKWRQRKVERMSTPLLVKTKQKQKQTKVNHLWTLAVTSVDSGSEYSPLRLV